MYIECCLPNTVPKNLQFLEDQFFGNNISRRRHNNTDNSVYLQEYEHIFFNMMEHPIDEVQFKISFKLYYTY